MNKANEPAFVVDRADGEFGLTKRELLAMNIYQSAINPFDHPNINIGLAIKCLNAANIFFEEAANLEVVEKENK